MATQPLQKRRSVLFFRGLSIRQRLPLLICTLLLIVILVFSWSSYIGVKNAAMKMGKARLQTLTGQLSSLFGQSAQAVLIGTHTAASQEPVKKILREKVIPGDSSALLVLQKLRTDSSWVLVQLLNADRMPVLSSGFPGVQSMMDMNSLSSSFPIEADSVKIGKFYSYGDSIYYAVIAAVSENKQVKGYLVRWRLQKATEKAVAELSGLLGSNTVLYVGNADGSFWSDMNKRVDPPGTTIKPGNQFYNYSRAKNGKVLATARPIAHTPWVVLTEVSRQKVLESANRFLGNIFFIGIPLILLGFLITWWMSRNLTRPLKKLTHAASSIAGGNYDTSVDVDRRDEIGKLARAFNAMTIQVSNAKYNLEKKVVERTSQLEKANKELEAFSYSVSHDLRAPLRAINGYATILKEDYVSQMDPEANRLADKITTNAKMMGQLIDDLISFSQLSRKDVNRQLVDMKNLAETCLAELSQHDPAHKLQVLVHPLPACHADKDLIKQVWMNLISNALKYTSKKPVPCIEIGCQEGQSMHRYFITDNGVGFDMQYAHKLFGVFQRLHSQTEFEGTGVGLAPCEKDRSAA
ncbi:MAG TPA: HAMP domain-containing protein [Chitinophagaceae bacterium]|nr:HAMP domain-containing protein [Chitinophagaceae bacterium]